MMNIMEYDISWDWGSLHDDDRYIDEYKEYILTLEKDNKKGKTYMEIMKERLGNFEDWEWVGGCLPNYEDDQSGIAYFNYYFKGKRDPPEIENRCVCTHDIYENCWIYNRQTDIVEVVGNCCIQKFMGNSNKKNGKIKKCKNCKSPHNNRKTVYCNKCRDYQYCKSCDKHISPSKRICDDCNIDKKCLKCGKKTKGYDECFKCHFN